LFLEKHVALFLGLEDHLVVLVDDRDGEEDTSTRADGAHEICDDGEGTDAHTTESGGGGDVLVEDRDDGFFTVALHDHLLVAQLLGDVTRGGARDVNPHAGQRTAKAEHERDVEDGVKRINPQIAQAAGRRHVVGQTADGDGLTRVVDLLPLSEQVDEHVGLKALVEELRDEVHVGDERGLENDGDVGSVEQLDGV